LEPAYPFPGPEVEKKSKLEPSAIFDMIDKFINKHSQINVLATTLREVYSTNHHSWRAMAWIDVENKGKL
jgi:2-dehydro-3-deoxygluconokinase